MEKMVEVYVPLLDEGTPTLRGTQAIYLGGDLYKILATPKYDPEDETWEFLPGSIVKCKEVFSAYQKRNIFHAYAVQMPDGSFKLSEDMGRLDSTGSSGGI